MNSVFSDKEAIEIFKAEMLNLLNSELSSLSPNASPRAVGDFAQDVIEEYFVCGLSHNIGKASSVKFGRADD